MFRYGGPIKEGIMHGMKEPQAINTAGSPLAPKDETGRGGYALPLLGLVPAGLQAARMAAMRFAPRVISAFRSRPFIEGGGKGIAGKYQPAPLTTTEKIKQFFQTAPAGKVIAADPLVKTAFGSGKVASKFVKPAAKYAFGTPSGLLLTGYGASKMLGGGDELPETTEEVSELQRVDTIGETEKKVDPDKLKQLNEDRIDRTKKRYYELMGS